MLGFAVTLAISAASMGFAYLGFERVSAGVDAYRHSVQEADLARNIDRELISYRSLARYFVATGKEEDGKAALAAEAGLKDADHRLDEGHHQPGAARSDHEAGARIPRLHQDFCRYPQGQGRERADRAKPADCAAAPSLRYKLDDLPSNADDSELQAITFGAKKVAEQFQAVIGARQHFRRQLGQVGRGQRTGASEISSRTR